MFTSLTSIMMIPRQLPIDIDVLQNIYIYDNGIEQKYAKVQKIKKIIEI